MQAVDPAAKVQLPNYHFVSTMLQMFQLVLLHLVCHKSALKWFVLLHHNP